MNKSGNWIVGYVVAYDQELTPERPTPERPCKSALERGNAVDAAVEERPFKGRVKGFERMGL